MKNNVIALPIPVRRMDFDFADLDKYWYQGSPWVTHFLNAMSAVFPDGERFFMHAVRLYEKDITDPELKAQIRDFIGQEANHGKEHEAFNHAIEDQHGIRMRSLMRASKEGIDWVKKKFPKRLQLSMTVGFEHFTAILAHQFLNNPETMAGIPKKYSDMFMWHAVEETEHKAVAFDVFNQVDGSYPMRVAGMLISSTLFFIVIPKFAFHLIKKDGQGSSLKEGLKLGYFMFGNPGLYRKILPDYLDFFRPNFHPWDHDNRALVSQLIEQLKPYEIKRAVNLH